MPWHVLPGQRDRVDGNPRVVCNTDLSLSRGVAERTDRHGSELPRVCGRREEDQGRDQDAHGGSVDRLCLGERAISSDQFSW